MMLTLLVLTTTLLVLPYLIRAEDDPTFTNTVYLIRNGETNTKKVGSGLNATGLLRANCLPRVRSLHTVICLGG